ncbi:MAG: 8-oxo-dGTP diphosphatase MutT, partial [Syntrophus sp. (in: bacteria)]|nr:8-oxo-dGTP diphosphatase MutT [Syntrophus sp. (in: bacteria)]
MMSNHAAYISGDFLLKDHEEIRWVTV